MGAQQAAESRAEGLPPPRSDPSAQAHHTGFRLVWAALPAPRLLSQGPRPTLGKHPSWAGPPWQRAGRPLAATAPAGPLCQDFTQRSLFSDRSHGGKSATAPLPGGFMTSAVLAPPPLTYSDSSRWAWCQPLAPGGSFPEWPVLTGPFKSCISWLFLNRFVYFVTVLYNKIGH